MSTKRSQSQDRSTVTLSTASSSSLSPTNHIQAFPTNFPDSSHEFEASFTNMSNNDSNATQRRSNRGRDDRARSRSRPRHRSRTRSTSRDGQRNNVRSRSTRRHSNSNLHRLDTSVDSRGRSATKRSRSRSRSVSRAHSDAGSESSGVHILSMASEVSPSTVQEYMDVIEPNVHESSICTEEITGPAIQEMKENELFARKAGINYSQQGGDYLTLLDKPYDPNQSVNGFSFSAISPRPVSNSSGRFFGSFFDFNRAEHHEVNDNEDNFTPEIQDESFCSKSSNKLNMIENEKDLEQLQLFAKQLRIGKGQKFIAAVLARRLRDFQFAQHKRKKKFGNERPWGILGLYDHLAAIRTDVEWAEDAARRRYNNEPYSSWADFIASKNSGYNRPFFTYVILFICTVFLIVSVGVNSWAVEPLSTNPMIGPSAETLLKMGAKQTILIAKEKEIWRIFSPMVLHAGLIHYFLNMLALWFVGSAVERSHGFFPALIIFVVPAIGGTVLSAIFLPQYISVGASGGIFGLIGACLADIVMNWKLLFSNFVNGGSNNTRHAMIIFFLFLDIVVNCLLGLTPFVDNFTHVGGMVFGFLCGLSTMQRLSTDFFLAPEEKYWWSITKNLFWRFFGIIISFLGIAAAIIYLLESDGKPATCNACKTLSCVTFPPWAGAEDKWWYCDDCGSVSADAKFNSESERFEQLFIHCPGSSTITVNLDNTITQTDKGWLESNLPKFCRMNCPGI